MKSPGCDEKTRRLLGRRTSEYQRRSKTMAAIDCFLVSACRNRNSKNNNTYFIRRPWTVSYTSDKEQEQQEQQHRIDTTSHRRATRQSVREAGLSGRQADCDRPARPPARFSPLSLQDSITGCTKRPCVRRQPRGRQARPKSSHDLESEEGLTSLRLSLPPSLLPPRRSELVRADARTTDQTLQRHNVSRPL